MLLIPNLSITSITIRNNFLARELGGTPVSKLFSRNWLNGIFSKFSTGHHATRIKLFIINSKRTRISRVLENATRWEFIPPFPTIVVSTSLVARYVHISRSNMFNTYFRAASNLKKNIGETIKKLFCRRYWSLAATMIFMELFKYFYI